MMCMLLLLSSSRRVQIVDIYISASVPSYNAYYINYHRMNMQYLCIRLCNYNTLFQTCSQRYDHSYMLSQIGIDAWHYGHSTYILRHHHRLHAPSMSKNTYGSLQPRGPLYTINQLAWSVYDWAAKQELLLLDLGKWCIPRDSMWVCHRVTPLIDFSTMRYHSVHNLSTHACDLLVRRVVS